MKISIIEIDYPFNSDTPSLYCPACGEKVLDEQGCSIGCNHIEFIYVSDVDEFEFIKKELETKIDQFDPKDDEQEDWSKLDILQNIYDKDNAFILGQTTSGMACGPTSPSVYVGFHMIPEA